MSELGAADSHAESPNGGPTDGGSPNGPTAVEGRQAWWLYGLNFLQATGIGLVFVFLADVQDRYGLANWELGVIAAMGFVAALITQLGLSPLIDRGHIQTLAWVAVAAGTLGTLGFAFGTNLITLGLSRGLSGIGLGLFNVVARKALIGLDIEGGGAKVGTLLSTGVSGFLAGPAIGAALGAIAFEAPFIVLATAFVIVGAPAAKIAGGAKIATAKVDYADLGRIIRKPRMQVAMLTQFIVFGAIGIFDATVDRFLTDLGASTVAVAIALLVTGLPLMIIPPRAGALAERIGGIKVLIPALIVAVPAVAAFGLAPSAGAFAIVGLVHSTTESFSTMGGQVLVLEATGAEKAAIGSAVVEVVGLSIAAVTSVMAPIIYGEFGPERLFGGWAAIAFVLVAITIMRTRSISSATPI